VGVVSVPDAGGTNVSQLFAGCWVKQAEVADGATLAQNVKFVGFGEFEVGLANIDLVLILHASGFDLSVGVSPSIR